ncbi:MAG: substrate-binding domain-containing protein [Armatimonadetes bacterium]|nr:substrate-binding domain-containing protein [Armatimonadota bacterium]
MKAASLWSRGRVVVLLVAVCAAMSLMTPEFATLENAGNLARSTSCDLLAAIGFTLVMLVGQLDLSIGVTMTLGGTTLLTVGNAWPAGGWLPAVLATMLVGALVGLFNGLLVTKARINSFIVTLGTMTILQGLCRAVLHGGSLALANAQRGSAMTDWLQPAGLFSPRVLLVLVPLTLVEWWLRRTRAGRGLYLVGGQRDSAWYAGLPVDRYVIGAFVASGLLAACGGALTTAAQNTVMPNLGDKSLMLVVAAVIVGGTAMAGGRGSVVLSAVALVTLNALTIGLSFMGASKSAKLVAHGLVLAGVVLADALRTVHRDRVRGQRRELLLELAGRARPGDDAEGEDDMESLRRERTVAMVCVSVTACVAIVAIYAMWSGRQAPAPTATVVAQAPGKPAAAPAAEKPAVDPSSLKATDGQPLVWLDTSALRSPPRPSDPTALPEADPLHWFDSEYSGWNAPKLAMPPSPRSGPKGKRVVSLQYMNHPYWQSYSNGMKRLAEAYGVDLTIMEAGNDVKVQMDQVEQAIQKKPDLVVLTPVDSKGAVPMLKRLYDAKVPTIASNLLPVDEGMKYVITWTGPDDWGQFRMLAREFAQKMGNQGGYAVVRHIAGTSCFYSRTYGALSELAKVAPAMKCLDMQTTELKTEETKTQVAAWLKKFGSELKGIVSADDSKAQVGINEALKAAGRTDVICVAAGSSRTGLELIKAGQLHAITYQSAEADGALPIEIAVRWFRGEAITRPVYYLQKAVITKANVDQYLPAQW